MEQDITILILCFFGLWVLGLWWIWSRPGLEIKELSPNNLILNIYPVIFRIIARNHQLLGVILLLFPLCAVPQITFLVCERNFQSLSPEKIELTATGVRCEIEEIGWLGHVNNISLAQLQGADLKTTLRKNKDISYQVVLLTEKNKIPLRWYGDFQRESYEALTTKINSFVKNSTDKTLTVQQDEREFAYFFWGLGGFIFLLSFLFLGIGTTTRCLLELDSDSLTLEHKRFYGLKILTDKLALKDITEAKIEYNRESETKSTSRITLILNTGKKIPLNRTYSSDKKEAIATAINNFLEICQSEKKNPI